MIDTCAACGSREFRTGDVDHRLEVAGAVAEGTVEASVCVRCGEEYVAADELRRFELMAAKTLLQEWPKGEIFAFARRAIGMKAAELADLLGVAAETVSRWERGHQEPPRTAFIALLMMVLDALGGGDVTRTALDRMASTPSAPPRVRVPDAA